MPELKVAMNKTSEPILLLIETSGVTGHVGVGSGNQLRGEATLNRSGKHTRDLMPECQTLCNQLNVTPQDIDALVVSAGPGSYTGLRVGMMTAKAMAYALNRPLISLNSFEIVARQAFDADSTISLLEVVADAQQDRVYIQRFTNPLQAENNLSIVQGEMWRASLSAGMTVTGPGLKQQQSLLPVTIRIMDESLWQPQLNALLQLGYQAYQNQQFADPFTLEPLYLRASSAEEQWTAMGK